MWTSLRLIHSPKCRCMCVRALRSTIILHVYDQRWPFHIIWSIRNSFFSPNFFLSRHCFARKIVIFVESNKRTQTRSNIETVRAPCLFCHLSCAVVFLFFCCCCLLLLYFVVYLLFLMLVALDADSIFRMSVNRYCGVCQCQVNAQCEQQWALVLYK